MTNQKQSEYAWLKDSVSLTVFTEIRADFVEILDQSDKIIVDSWDAYLDTTGMRVKTSIYEWLTTVFVVELTDVGKKDDPVDLSISEAFVMVKYPGYPFYYTGGKRTLPFGSFKDRMVGGTLTEDLYEINEPGITFGFNPSLWNLDFSLTAYDGQNVIENLEKENVHVFRSDRQNKTSIDSLIVNLTLEPVQEVLELSLFYDTEPGDGNRNQSAGGAVSLWVWRFVIDGEYITALQREPGEDWEENLESAGNIAIALQIIEPLEIAARFERLFDDRRGEQNDIASRRYSTGMNYNPLDYILFSVEFRRSLFERELGTPQQEAQNEIQVQLTLEY